MLNRCIMPLGVLSALLCFEGSGVRVVPFFKLKGERVSLGGSLLLLGLFSTAAAAPLSWQLHMPEASDEAQSQSQALAQPSLNIAEAQWRSDVIAQLLAKNISGAQQLLNTAPTQGVPLSLLTSRAAWLLGFGLVPWAETTLEAASRQNNELDTTQQKTLQHLKASFGAAYATEQTPMAILRDCANVLPALLVGKPNIKPYRQWQVLEGPERLSAVTQLQRQEIALLGASLEQTSSPSETFGEPLFPASLKPSLVEVIRTLKATQGIVNDAAGAVEIGLHQRHLTPTEYSHQSEEVIGFLVQQQQRVAVYRNRLERRVEALSENSAQLIQWKNALREAVALVTLHEAAVAALREAVETPFIHPSMLQPNRPKTLIPIVEELPVLEKSVMQHLQSSLNTWDATSVAQAMLESGLPLSFSKALSLDTERAVRMLTMPLPTVMGGAVSKKVKPSKATTDSEKKDAKTTETKP